jgi:hypothetical protein
MVVLLVVFGRFACLEVVANARYFCVSCCFQIVLDDALRNVEVSYRRPGLTQLTMSLALKWFSGSLRHRIDHASLLRNQCLGSDRLKDTCAVV